MLEQKAEQGHYERVQQKSLHLFLHIGSVGGYARRVRKQEYSKNSLSKPGTPVKEPKHL